MNKLFFRIIIPLWILIIIINAVIPSQEFSESENRYLAKFPQFSVDTLLNGEYMQQVDMFVNDDFAFRDNWINLKGNLEYAIGKRENNSIFLCKNAFIENISKPDKEMTNHNIRGIKAFCERFNKPSYLMLVPSASFIQKHKLPPFASSLSWDQGEFIDQVNDELNGIITPINVYQTLLDNKDEYIYYKTDHHWTSFGASLAYKEFAKTLKIPENNLKIETINENFFGTLSSKAGIQNVSADKIQSFSASDANITQYSVFDGKETKTYNTPYFEEYLDKKDKYSYFLGQNQPVVTIKTDYKNPDGSENNLLIFKDSYAHCFAPMLTGDYSQITLVDLRYINTEIEELIDLDSFDQSLFLFSTNVFSHQRLLSKLI